MVSTCKGITLNGGKCHRQTRQDFCHQHRKSFMQAKPEECIICLESIVKQRRALECGHWIHKQCVIKSAKAECPLCRAPLHLGPQATHRIEKLARKRAREQLEDEEEELRAEIFSTAFQEHIHNVVGYLLNDSDDINFVDVINAIFDDDMSDIDYDSTG